MEHLCSKAKILLGILAFVLAGSTNVFSQEPPYVVDSSNKNGEYAGLPAVRNDVFTTSLVLGL